MQRALSTHLLVNHRLTTVCLERIRDAGIPLVEIFCARQHLDYHNRAQIAELARWFRAHNTAATSPTAIAALLSAFQTAAQFGSLSALHAMQEQHKSSKRHS